jgi:antitoxin FitA
MCSMPTSITLKNIPDALYQSLKAAAVANHRSLNGQVLATLERTNEASNQPSPAKTLAAVRELRSTFVRGLSPDEIAAAIAQGRP